MMLTRHDVLKDKLYSTIRLLHFYSADPFMTEPAQGYEEAWHEANEERELLEAWLDEFNEKAAPDGNQEAAWAVKPKHNFTS